MLLSPVRFRRLPPLEGKQRRWVVGDIHGCLTTFQHAVEHIMRLEKVDQLVLLGDYIDRGPDNRGVLDYIMHLQNTGFQVFPLLGNHEYNFLEVSQTYERRHLRVYARQMKAEDLLDMTGDLPEKYRAWFFELPHYYTTEEALFVHGGFDFPSPDRFVPGLTMLELRRMQYIAEVAQHRMVFHGHQPHTAAEIEQAFARRGPIIPLDGGCVYAYSKPARAVSNGHGYLACLEMTEWRLTLVPNREFLP